MRNHIIDRLFHIMKQDSNVILLTGDLGYGLFDRFSIELPRQFINCGIAQQNMIGVACGLSKTGFKVYVYSISTFPTLRCLQQIRNDVIYHNCDVNIISVAGFTYGMLGYSHYALQDISVLNSLGGIELYSPSDNIQAERVLNHSYKNSSPSYIRVTVGSKLQRPCLYDDTRPQEICFSPDNTKLLLVTGGIWSYVQENLPAWSQYNIYAVSFISHIQKYILDILQRSVYTEIYTLQQHKLQGGFGSIIKDILPDEYRHIRITKMGVADIPEVVGDRDYMIKNYITWK